MGAAPEEEGLPGKGAAPIGGQDIQGLKLVFKGPSVSSGDKSQADILAKGLHSQGTRKSALQSGTFLFCLSINLGTRNGPGTSPSPSPPLWRNGVERLGKEGGKQCSGGVGRRGAGPGVCAGSATRLSPVLCPVRTPTQALLLPPSLARGLALHRLRLSSPTPFRVCVFGFFLRVRSHDRVCALTFPQTPGPCSSPRRPARTVPALTDAE